MIRGKKYFNKDVVYVSFNKHYCPDCKTKLKTVKVSKIVNYNSLEAKDFDFRIRSGVGPTTVVTGDCEFSWKEFKCPNCKRHFTVEELKKIEGVGQEDFYEDEQFKKRNTARDLIIFFAIGIVIAVIIYLLKR